VSPVHARTGSIDAAIELYDSDIKTIMDGPMEWFNSRTGSWRVIDEVHKGLVEQFEKVGFKVDVEVWTLGECKCSPPCRDGEHCRHLVPIPEAYQFGVMITGKINRESSFDFDKMVHEVQNNLLDIPGEGGIIKFDEAEARRMMGESKH
jgi:hypothetical protein